MKKLILSIILCLISTYAFALSGESGQYVTECTNSNVILNEELRSLKKDVSYVLSDYAIPSGVIVMWSGTIATIPAGWLLCDGGNGTPDLRDRFIVGANQDDAGAAKTNITGSLTVSGNGTIPEHLHAYGTIAVSNANESSHTHGVGSYAIANESAHTHDVATDAAGTGHAGEATTVANVYGFESSGAGSAHTHSFSGSSAAGSSHGHTATVSGSTANTGTGTVNIAKYYALAYIMKE
jgi:hypothetical protein